MPAERAPSRKVRKARSVVSADNFSPLKPDELMRYMEEHLAVARELLKVAHDLYATAAELREIAEIACAYSPTLH